MKNILTLSCIAFLFFSCLDKKKQEPSQTTVAPEAIVKDTVQKEEKEREMEPIVIDIDGSYFKASGTEPFWDIKLHNNKVILKTTEGTVQTPSTEPIKAQESNIAMYRIQTEATLLDVIIAHKECTNAMSGEVFPYTVTVSYKNTGGAETKVYEGCGYYLPDYRIHDIWVLEKMQGTTVSKEDFNGNDVPNMEVNINNNRFSGFSGCNRMNGSLFYEKDVLRFTQIASTRMACPNMEKESEFLSALQSSVNYKIENNRLYLSNDSEENLLIFKKID